MKGKVAAAVLALLIGLVAYWEGYRTKPYSDVVGVLTVCYGHTGPDIIAGRVYTRAECEALLRADLAVANAHVHRCVVRNMPPNVEAALTSLVFNVGPRAVCGSTLQRFAQAGNWPATCAQISRWDRAGGRQVKGLVRRRAAERALCEGRA